MTEIVTVTISGKTGSGKSRIALEILAALQAAGVAVSFPDREHEQQALAEAHSEANGGWQPSLPSVVILERNVPRECGA